MKHELRSAWRHGVPQIGGRQLGAWCRLRQVFIGQKGHAALHVARDAHEPQRARTHVDAVREPVGVCQQFGGGGHGARSWSATLNIHTGRAGRPPSAIVGSRALVRNQSVPRS